MDVAPAGFTVHRKHQRLSSARSAPADPGDPSADLLVVMPHKLTFKADLLLLVCHLSRIGSGSVPVIESGCAPQRWMCQILRLFIK